ncbi:hypothetical protein ACOMHN_012975 [Nucella lapillus]
MAAFLSSVYYPRVTSARRGPWGELNPQAQNGRCPVSSALPGKCLLSELPQTVNEALNDDVSFSGLRHRTDKRILVYSGAPPKPLTFPPAPRPAGGDWRLARVCVLRLCHSDVNVSLHSFTTDGG